MSWTLLRRTHRLLFDTALWVIGLIAVKVAIIELFSLEFFNLSPLFTSIIAGGVFILSIILSGTLADYKESEKLPSEIAAAIEAIYAEGRYVRQRHSTFHLELLRQVLADLATSIRSDLEIPEGRHAVEVLDRLSSPFSEMEDLGVPANAVVRLKQEQATIRRSLFRIYHIQRIRFIPSASTLARSIVILIIGLLLLTRIEPVHDSLILVGFIAFIFIYLLKLVHTIDQPFRVGEYTMDDVSLFLLREVHERVGRETSERASGPASRMPDDPVE